MTDHLKFAKKLPECDIAWVIAGTSALSEAVENRYMAAIGEFMRRKKSLFLWVDKTPLFVGVNCILKKHFGGMYMDGNYIGMKTITRADRSEKGKFDGTHAIAYGLNNIHEGYTIAHPVNTHADFKEFARNSNDEPLVLFAEENENHGRIIIDTGFTKLFEAYWANAGTHQYVSNANVWLTGLI